MKDLIQVRNENGELLVSARELHDGLEIGKDFTNWMKFIAQYGFDEGSEIRRIWEDTRGNKTGEVEITSVEPLIDKWAYRSDYILTLDVAKEICMIQRNEKGKQFRKYFIWCEKQLKQQIPSYQIDDRIKRAERWIEEEKERQLLEGQNQVLETKIKIAEPKVEKFDNFLDKDGTFGFRELCKHLNGRGLNIKETQLRKYLIETKIICKQGKKYVVTQEGVRQGYGKLLDNMVDDKNRPTTRYTDKLRDKILEDLSY